MRPGFGAGVSIPSQRRWVGYVEAWARSYGKRYTERRLRIHSLHILGLRRGVRIAIQGFVSGGKMIHTFHTFHRTERSEVVAETADTADVVLTPPNPVLLPSSDVNIDFERRGTTTGVLTSLAHVWFNAFFEGKGGAEDSGVFEIPWAEMDGVKGTLQKGVQALEKLQVVWSVDMDTEAEEDVDEEAVGADDDGDSLVSASDNNDSDGTAPTGNANAPDPERTTNAEAVNISENQPELSTAAGEGEKDPNPVAVVDNTDGSKEKEEK
jgi:hypothetical protein